MGQWQSVLDNPPQTVGLYRLKDARGNEFMVRWDGRNFRYASGLMAGAAVVHFIGDKWREIKEQS
ncbi:hypothetical protein CBM2599_A120516 [Cupriavidus taiwanensis]|uniref:hypothetical protein n=1 Tax=Cupriavidus taiwanensis TaxID=164546 RepID=UPI000E157351|nr:hypothetical protein [Cupriavidus taiwanensis]SOY79951.1 hypothetical protein CBM2599_A120516 [Cupriavidus taiwanensis]SOY81921.1 hypothetical protein CBM2600_A120539 [Cupriavidus taiwanensis]